MHPAGSIAPFVVSSPFHGPAADACGGKRHAGADAHRPLRPLEWTGCLNNIRACAREIVEKEIIFA